MNDTQLFDALKKAGLTPAEKATMKSSLLDFVARHPVQSVPSHYFNHHGPVPTFLHHFLLRPMALALGVVLVLGGGVTASAEHALPGDLLYPVKVHINEPLIGLTAVSSERKAEWDAKLVDRRRAEVEQLIAESRLDDHALKVSEESLKRVTERATEHLKTLETDNPEASARVDAEITASLTDYDHALDTFEEGRASTTSSGLQDLHERVRQDLHRAPEEKRAPEAVSATQDTEQKDKRGAAADEVEPHD